MTWRLTSRQLSILLILGGAFLLNLLSVALAIKVTLGSTFKSNSVNLVVAQLEIPIGTVLRQDQLTIVQVPATAVPQAGFTKIEDLVGRLNINDIGPREAITEYRLVPKTKRSARLLVPEGYRAITVQVDADTEFLESIEAGAIVDLTTIAKAATRKPMKPKLLLRNIKVFATKPSKVVGQPNAVTLLVKPKEAECLVRASYAAPLHMIVSDFGCR